MSASYGDARWIKVRGGGIPEKEGHYVPLIAGYENGGEKPLYAARVHHEGGIHPGKAGAHLGGANFGYGGREICHTGEYEVLFVNAKGATEAHWVIPHTVDANVLRDCAGRAAGQEHDGRPLWVARVKHEGGLHVGKAGAHLNGCNYSYGGKELTKGPKEAEVLIFHDPF